MKWLLQEKKNDIMDLKQHIENIELNGNIGSYPDSFVIPKEKLADLTFEDFEQELLTFYWNKYNGNVNRIARKLNYPIQVIQVDGGPHPVDALLGQGPSDHGCRGLRHISPSPEASSQDIA